MTMATSNLITSTPTVQPLPTKYLITDLTGQVHNSWTVIGYGGKSNGSHKWICQCECGTYKLQHGNNVTSGKSQSCGCKGIAKQTTHGYGRRTNKKPPEYRAYFHARDRCTDPNHKAYSSYGGRGIEFRFTNFSDFLAAVGPRPSRYHSIERIDNEGHYETGNLRWATKKEQQRNLRTNRMITHNGETRCMAEWAEITGIAYNLLTSRLHRKMCMSCALTISTDGKPVRCTHRQKL